MTRYAIDVPVAVRLVRERLGVPEGDSLVGPAALRSAVSAELYRAVRAGEVDARTGDELLDVLASLPVRLLGDRVSRRTAWRIAARLGWDDLGPAEVLAVAQLQADVLVTDDPVLLAAADGVVPVEPASALLPG